jgi:hypothetical protein
VLVVVFLKVILKQILYSKLIQPAIKLFQLNTKLLLMLLSKHQMLLYLDSIKKLMPDGKSVVLKKDG